MELSEIRAKINIVDDQLLDLFLQRMALAEEVGRYKKEHHLPILNSQREQAVLDRIAARAGAYDRYACELFSTLFALSRDRQEEILSATETQDAENT